jgi:hypothetical protein
MKPHSQPSSSANCITLDGIPEAAEQQAKGSTPRVACRPLVAEGVREQNFKFVCALPKAQALAYAHFTRVCGSGQSGTRATGVHKTPMKERAGALQ